jgi:hypothetical protein
MLKEHFQAIESTLLATSKIPANSGHSLHKGTPREAFIQEFLQKHLSSTVEIGTGEIIDANSSPNSQRNQYDLVLYKKNYPKLDFGGGISGFLAESVIATIEVKSTLDKSGLVQSINAARKSKALTQNLSRSFSSGWIPPSIMNYVIAYDGPQNIKTVYDWLARYHFDNSIDIPKPDSNGVKISPSLDGVYILDKGFIKYENSPTSLIPPEVRSQHQNINWSIVQSNEGVLLTFFLSILECTNNIEGAWLNAIPYLKSLRFNDVSWS